MPTSSDTPGGRTRRARRCRSFSWRCHPSSQGADGAVQAQRGGRTTCHRRPIPATLAATGRRFIRRRDHSKLATPAAPSATRCPTRPPNHRPAPAKAAGPGTGHRGIPTGPAPTAPPHAGAVTKPSHPILTWSPAAQPPPARPVPVRAATGPDIHPQRRDWHLGNTAPLISDQPQ